MEGPTAFFLRMKGTPCHRTRAVAKARRRDRKDHGQVGDENERQSKLIIPFRRFKAYLQSLLSRSPR